MTDPLKLIQFIVINYIVKKPIREYIEIFACERPRSRSVTDLFSTPKPDRYQCSAARPGRSPLGETDQPTH